MPKFGAWSERRKRIAGFGVVFVASVLILVVPVLRALRTDILSFPRILGVVFPVLWVTIVWAGLATLRPRLTGDDTLVVGGWCVLMATNFGLILGIIVAHQQSVGVEMLTPGLLVSGGAGAGLVNGLLVGVFHQRARERRRRVEEERARLDRRSEQLTFVNRLLRHDIRNDINVVQGYAELLAAAGVENAEPILRKGNHIEELTALATDVVDSFDETQEPVPLDTTLSNALAAASTSFPEAEFAVEGEVPSVRVVGSRLLESAFENVLRNGVQHSDAATPRVTVRAAAGPDTVTVRVSDNGAGIPESVREELFSPGRKAGEAAGMGLGLYLVKAVVDAARGEIRVENGTADVNAPDGEEEAENERSGDANPPAEGAVVTLELRRADSADEVGISGRVPQASP